MGENLVISCSNEHFTHINLAFCMLILHIYVLIFLIVIISQIDFCKFHSIYVQ